MKDRLLQLIFDERAIALTEHGRLFNPLRVLGVEHYEIRHANTLAWLMRPTESHGLGDSFARLFLNKVCQGRQPGGEPGYEVLYKIASSGTSSLHVRREVPLDHLRRIDSSEADAASQGELREENDDGEAPISQERSGFLDVLIEGHDWVVAIEAKVRSGQQFDQLPRYREAIESGAKGRRKMLVYLTSDEADKPTQGWNHLTWDEAVVEPLKKLFEGIPAARLNEPQYAFLMGFIDVVEEHCKPPRGRREELLGALVADYSDVLNRLSGRKNRGKLAEDVSELVRLHSELINRLTQRFVAPNTARAPMLREVIKSDPRLVLIPGDDVYIRFAFEEWLKHEWLVIPKRPKRAAGYAATIELHNTRDDGIRFKLVIRDLGFAGPNQEMRQALFKKILDDPDAATVRQLFPNAFRGSPAKEFPGILYTEWLPPPDADDPASVKKYMDDCLIASAVRLTQYIEELTPDPETLPVTTEDLDER